MRKKSLVVLLTVALVLTSVACAREEKKEETNTTVQGQQTEEPEIDSFLTDENYDPSVADYIGRARAFAEGYVENYGTNQRTVGNNTTIFIGDSFFDHRYFWPDFYTKYYVGKDVFLAGIGGTTTQHWNCLVDTVFYGFKGTQPKNIVIHLGTNDLWAGEGRPTDIVNGLQRLFNTLHQKFPNTKIYYFGITRRADGSAQDRIDMVNADMTTWCANNSEFMTYIDTTNRIQPSDLMSDNLHPRRETYQKFVDALQEAGCEIMDEAE